jgi:hypothetical protein
MLREIGIPEEGEHPAQDERAEENRGAHVEPRAGEPSETHEPNSACSCRPPLERRGC